MSISSGIVYVATGSLYIDEAFRSAAITKLHSEDYPIYLYTDSPEYALALNGSQLFDSINVHNMPILNYRDKIPPLIQLPFDRTLFLDTDAFLVSPFTSLLSLPYKFDLAACYSPVRHPPGWSDSLVPDSFPEINTGVLFFNNSLKISSLIKNWLRLYDSLYESYNQSWDQASFRSVLWNHIIKEDLNFFVLPDEFNLRTTKPWIVGRGSPAYVVHGRFPENELNSFLDYINGDIDTFRTWSIWSNIYPDTSIRPRHDRTFD